MQFKRRLVAAWGLEDSIPKPEGTGFTIFLIGDRGEKDDNKNWFFVQFQELLHQLLTATDKMTKLGYKRSLLMFYDTDEKPIIVPSKAEAKKLRQLGILKTGEDDEEEQE